MQSLKHELSNVVFNCCKIDIPMNNGYELSPSSNLSQRWMILCNGKTSEMHNKDRNENEIKVGSKSETHLSSAYVKT